MPPWATTPRGVNWPKASETVQKIATLRRLAPVNSVEVKSGDRLLFRVYYDQDDALTRAYIAALPQARRAICDFYGSELAETAVFLFEDVERCNAFRATWDPRIEERKWSDGTANRGFITICLRRPSGSLLSSHPDDIAHLLQHECSHALQGRKVGRVTVPTWFEEGMAEYCGALGLPRRSEENQLKVLTIAQKGAHWLPLGVITDRHQFYLAANNSLAYTQAFAMTRYMISTYGKQTVIDLFMDGLTDDWGVDAAFLKALGVDEAGFYNVWFNAPS